MASSDPVPSPSRDRVVLSRRKKLIFGVAAAVAGLGAIEGICRLAIGVAPNPRWDYERRHLATEGLESLNAVLAPHPTRFWQLRPNLDNVPISGTVGGARLSFRLSTDDRGRRRMPPAADAARTVLFLGDSCTLGLGVEDDRTFPYLIQAGMAGVRCINAGVPGYTAYQGRVLADEWTDRAFPAVVVVTFGINDGYPWDGLSDLEHGRAADAERHGWAGRFGMTRLIRGLVRPDPAPMKSNVNKGRPRLNEAEFDEQIRLIVDRCRAGGGVPVLVIWPRLWPWKRAVLQRIGQKEAIRVVDLGPAFQGRGDRDLFVDSVHAGAAGCELVAETLIPFLQAELKRAAGGS